MCVCVCAYAYIIRARERKGGSEEIGGRNKETKMVTVGTCCSSDETISVRSLSDLTKSTSSCSVEGRAEQLFSVLFFSFLLLFLTDDSARCV